MSGFTPGPWRRCGGATPQYMAICDNSNRCIVFRMADNLADTERGKPIDAPGMAEQFANARLIAAAPDLLEAVKAWLEFNRETKAENPCPDLALRSRLREKAKALSESAIAKATGETK